MNQFNEANTIEQMLIEKAQLQGWTYVPANKMPRATDFVLVESWLLDALLRLNREIEPEDASIIISKLRAAIAKGIHANEIVTANDFFRELLVEKNSFPVGKDGEHIPIRFFSEDMSENYCVVTNQWEFPQPTHKGGKRLDLVYLINGIPLVIGETKSPTKPSVTWAEGALDILHYQQSIPEMFVPNVLSFATDGKEFYYGAVGAPISKWGPWYANESRASGDLASVALNAGSLLRPARILDIYRFYTVFTSTEAGRRIKIVCRYQQYHGGEAIVQRVLQTRRQGQGPRQGLIWHFQGSGKSWLMVFAAQKLRLQSELNAPTILIVDDRIDLEDQITGDFTRAEIPNVENVRTRQELVKKIHQRKILITTIFKFAELDDYQAIDERDNIILLVDEAHRTQEGDLGRKMRAALPNAFFFGLTGTPINKNYHNTFACFGSEEDASGYISKYTFQDSIDDGATLELNFTAVPVELHLNKEALQKEFDELIEEERLTENQRRELVRRTDVEAFFTADLRIQQVCQRIVEHFRKFVEPTGLKAQVVVYNRECCVKYKKCLDMLLGTTDQTTIVMHTDGDKADLYKEYKRSRDEEKKLLNEFRDPLSPLKFVIVTSKLLTGFDAPILHCMYLDKPMRNHTLLQAICRTNRKYDANKKCGLIVDFVGVFDDVAKALAYEEESIKHVVRNIEEIKSKIPELVNGAIHFFPGVDRTVGGWDGICAAQECLKDEAIKTQFAKAYCLLMKAWEIVSPDECLAKWTQDYTWLTQVYKSITPPGGGSGLGVWLALGAKTIEIVHRNIERIDIGRTVEDLVVDSGLIDSLIEDVKNHTPRILEIEKMLRVRLGTHKSDPAFKHFAEKLDELREKMNQNLIASIDFLKELLKLAKEILEEEKKKNQPQDKREQAKAALTELFESIKTEDTPIVVENVVNDIDNEVVKIVRQFKDAFQSTTARREIKKKLRAILWIKYKIKADDIFEKAYQYIEQYY